MYLRGYLYICAKLIMYIILLISHYSTYCVNIAFSISVCVKLLDYELVKLSYAMPSRELCETVFTFSGIFLSDTWHRVFLPIASSADSMAPDEVLFEVIFAQHRMLPGFILHVGEILPLLQELWVLQGELKRSFSPNDFFFVFLSIVAGAATV